MWKFVTRGIRQSLERRDYRSNIYSQTPSSQDSSTKSEVKKNLTRERKFLLPNFSSYSNGFCGSAKSSGTGDKQHQSKCNPKYTWTEAVGWFSASAIGWVVCQSLCFHRRYFERESNETLHTHILPVSKAHIPDLLTRLLNLNPKYILPIANCISDSNNKQLVEKKDEYITTDDAFGPITSDRAFKEATNEFANVHKFIIGEFELKFGIKALEEKRYKDAFEHFTVGAELSSASSTFNLGLCHELGLGTLTDLVKAAKYYSDAAELGHADAMYNLGVFHARGEGGLPIDNDMAHKCFVKAAELGQVQAQYALNLENTNFRSKRDYHFTSTSIRNYSTKQISGKNRQNLSFEVLEYPDVIQEKLEYIENTKSLGSYGQKLKKNRHSISCFFHIFGLNKSTATTVE